MAENTALANPAKTSALERSTVKALLEGFSDELQKVLPKHLTVDRMLKTILYSIDENPDLLKCTQKSLLSAIKQCAELGLEPGKVRGHVYMVPYKVGGADLGRRCEVIVGYKGLQHLARRSGTVVDIETEVVYPEDRFEYERGLTPRLRHVPSLKGRANRTPLAVWCIVHLRGGHKHVEVMPWDDVLAIKARSKAKSDGPWVTDEVEMGRKTVWRRASKYVDLSPEMVEALRHLGDEDEPRHVEMEINAPPLPKPAKKTLASGPAPEEIETSEEPERVAAPEAKREAKRAAAPPPEPEPEEREPGSDDGEEAPPHDPETGEVLEEAPRPKVGTVMHGEWMVSQLNKVASVDELAALTEEAGKVHEERREAVNAAYAAAKRRVKGGR